MQRQPGRRRVKKRKSRNQNNRMKFSWFLGIIILAVFLGFLTARFVVGPLIGYDAGESPARTAGESGGKKEDSEKKEKTEDKDKSEDGEETEASADLVLKDGYALQFGAFSTKEAAEELAESLKSQGIETEVVRMENIYKVISPVVDTREQALDALTNLPDVEVEDVFITSFSA